MRKILDFVTKIEENICAIGLLSTVFLIFANVILRYIFKNSSPWIEEAVRYITIWFTFIGAAICFKRSSHMGIDLILTLTKGRVKKAIEIFGIIASIIFMIFLLVYGMELAIFTKNSGQITPGLEIPLYGIYLGIPLGAFLSLIELVILFATKLKQNPEEVNL